MKKLISISLVAMIFAGLSACAQDSMRGGMAMKDGMGMKMDMKMMDPNNDGRAVPYGPDDGTLAPWALVASLPFAPEIVLPTLDYCIYQDASSVKSVGEFRLRKLAKHVI